MPRWRMIVFLGLAGIALPIETGSVERSRGASVLSDASKLAGRPIDVSREPSTAGASAFRVQEWLPEMSVGRREPFLLAQVPIGGNLYLESVGHSSCPANNMFFPGQQVRLHGSGFDNGAAVTIYFGAGDSDIAVLGTATADASGALDAVVTIPVGLSTPTMGIMDARGQVAGYLLHLTELVPIANSSSADTDSDGVLDVCDNCPNTPNPGQQVDDHDGKGNACDAWAPLAAWSALRSKGHRRSRAQR